MTPIKVLSEIQKMSLNEIREIAEQLADYLHEQEKAVTVAQEAETREDEFERYLLAKGVITHIPTRDETDEEFDIFEPLVVEDEPLSETIIRERR
jgi:electron transfer flavoprotein alpha/beta subunit